MPSREQLKKRLLATEESKLVLFFAYVRGFPYIYEVTRDSMICYLEIQEEKQLPDSPDEFTIKKAEKKYSSYSFIVEEKIDKVKEGILLGELPTK